MGPTTKAITVTGGVTFDQLRRQLLRAGQGAGRGRRRYPAARNLPGHAQRQGRAAGHPAADARTGPQDSRHGFGHHRAHGHHARRPDRRRVLELPISHVDLLSIGLNCATGPEFMTDHIRTLSEMASTRISCYPNAGLPNEDGKYLETPQSLADAAGALRRPRLAEHRGRLLRHHRGAHPGHRRRWSRARSRARRSAPAHRAYYSGHRAGGSRRQQPAADRRRAHQRDRLARCSRTWSPRRSGKRPPRSRAGR